MLLFGLPYYGLFVTWIVHFVLDATILKLAVKFSSETLTPALCQLLLFLVVDEQVLLFLIASELFFGLFLFLRCIIFLCLVLLAFQDLGRLLGRDITIIKHFLNFFSFRSILSFSLILFSFEIRLLLG